MAELKLPADEKTIRALKVGDFVELSGRMITGRDSAHKWLVEAHREEVAPYLEGSVIYHCGPVVAKTEDGGWRFVAAGPTTSIREEPYQADVIRGYRLRGVIGKGGMGKKTLDGLASGGAVTRVERVFMLEEFGVPEALWVIQVERFPVVVSMDSHGGSLHDEVEAASKSRLDELLAKK